VQCVKHDSKGTPKSIAISSRDASNVQVTTGQTKVTKKKNGVMSDVSSVVEIILGITREFYGLQGPTKENILTFSFENIHSSHTSNKPYTLNQECSNKQTKFFCSHKYRAGATHKRISSANQQYTGIKQK
jgi:hypothetical protein